MSDAIGTNFVMQKLKNNFLNVHNDFYKKSIDLTSGKQAKNYAKLAEEGQASVLIDLQTTVGKLSDFSKNNEIIINKLNTQDKALKNILDIAQQAKYLVTLRKSSNTPSIPIKENLQPLLGYIRDNLNTSFENEYLFAGGRTNSMPVGDIVNLSNIVGDEISANYYQGDSFVFYIQASNSLKISYGITANDLTFQQLIGAIHNAIAGDEQDNINMIDKASSLLDIAAENIVKLRANTDSNILNLKNVNKMNEETGKYYGEIATQITETDVIKTTVELNKIQVAIEASAMTINKISHLSLVEYLK